MTVQVKAIGQYFPVLVFMVDKVVSTRWNRPCSKTIQIKSLEQFDLPVMVSAFLLHYLKQHSFLLNFHLGIITGKVLQ